MIIVNVMLNKMRKPSVKLVEPLPTEASNSEHENEHGREECYLRIGKHEAKGQLAVKRLVFLQLVNGNASLFVIFLVASALGISEWNTMLEFVRYLR
jgi:hypothetical protein